MHRIGLMLAISVLLAGELQATSSLDFLQLERGTLTDSLYGDVTGYAALPGPDNSVYAVGISNGSSLQATPGALNLLTGRSVVFVTRYSANGARMFTAIVAEAEGRNGILATSDAISADIDAQGNIYIAIANAGAVAGTVPWQGEESDRLGVVKVAPNGDKLLYATRVMLADTSHIALDVDDGGFAYVAGQLFNEIKVIKLDANGARSSYAYTITDTSPSGTILYTLDQGRLGLAAGHDGSVYVSAGPAYVYRIHPDGDRLIYRAVVGGIRPVPPQQVYGLAVDVQGNAYVVGSTTYRNGFPFVADWVDFEAAHAESSHGYLMKLDPNGQTIYAKLFSFQFLTTIALDAAQNPWAGGVSPSGLHLLAFDGAGNPYRSNSWNTNGSTGLNGLRIDSAGRALFAGSTSSPTIPYTGLVSDNTYSLIGRASNGLFARTSAIAAANDLRLRLSAPQGVALPYGVMKLRAELSNSGAAPADDVVLQIQVSGANRLIAPEWVPSCQTTGGATCDPRIAGPSSIPSDYLQLAWPHIGAGQTETAEIQFVLIGNPDSPYLVDATAFTSSADSNPANNHVTQAYPLSTVRLNLSGVSLVRIEDSPKLDYANGPLRPFLPPDSDVRLFIPSDLNGRQKFKSWLDGSTENPRVFRTPPTGDLSLAVLTVTDPGPFVSPGAVVNGASFHAGAVAPGEVITLFGTRLGPGTLQLAALDPDGRIATERLGFRVTFDDVAAPIVYISQAQSAVIVPYSVAGKSQTQMRIFYNGAESSTTTFRVAESAPGLFSLNSSGLGPLAAFNSNGALNTRNEPAARGDIAVIYGTGEGMTTAPQDGAVAGNTPPKPMLPVSVTVGGIPAEIIYAGGVPGVTAGVLQVNFRVPTNVQPGLLPVVLRIGDNVSQGGATLAVR